MLKVSENKVNGSLERVYQLASNYPCRCFVKDILRKTELFQLETIMLFECVDCNFLNLITKGLFRGSDFTKQKVYTKDTLKKFLKYYSTLAEIKVHSLSLVGDVYIGGNLLQNKVVISIDSKNNRITITGINANEWDNMHEWLTTNFDKN